jgi:hypothetical protein
LSLDTSNEPEKVDIEINQLIRSDGGLKKNKAFVNDETKHTINSSQKNILLSADPQVQLLPTMIRHLHRLDKSKPTREEQKQPELKRFRNYRTNSRDIQTSTKDPQVERKSYQEERVPFPINQLK